MGHETGQAIPEKTTTDGRHGAATQVRAFQCRSAIMSRQESIVNARGISRRAVVCSSPSSWNSAFGVILT